MALEEPPFLQALMALKAGLQASPAACEGFSKALLQLSGRFLPDYICCPRLQHVYRHHDFACTHKIVALLRTSDFMHHRTLLRR